MKTGNTLHHSFLWFLGILLFFLCITPITALSLPGISDTPVTQVKVGNISMGYKEFGSGEPLVMIMGFSGAMDIWDPIILKNLSSQYRVIIFDNRGVGNTSDSGEPYSIPLFANDTVGLMDDLNISRAHILGWSMGGNIALQLAGDYPDRVHSLVLYAADPGGAEVIPMDAKVQEQLTNTSGTPRERGERFLSLILPPAWMAEHPDPREYFPDAREPVNASALAGQIQALSSWKGMDGRLNTIRSPTLVITGDADLITPPENAELMAKEIPSSTLIRVPDSGHGLMYQDPETFSRDVLTFLQSQGH